MELGLAGKVVIVTGGGAGIGAAISEQLAAEGAVPVIFARRAPEADWLAGLGPKAGWVQVDLADDQQCMAAVAEARTREGISTVFLTIAHRSQVVVHKQLALLDRAERDEANGDQLELLFQLDHLATRSRRNAENLIILGGEQPGRRWRNPVALMDLVRGAVAESTEYTRFQTRPVPEVRIAAHVVADVVHLLAELMDNATAFSPPESPVIVSGVIVGRGVVVEVIDQGLGMSESEFAERNAMLADPPDFSVAALSGNSRLGLFVVAKLAGRHDISVRFTESEYGGVRAVVLIPSALAEAADPSSPISGQFPAVAPRR